MNNKFKFENLSEDQKKIVRDQYKLLSKLTRFSNKVNNSLFKKLFGDKIGDHLIYKYVYDYKCNFLAFYNSLSADNQSIILCNIELNEELYY